MLVKNCEFINRNYLTVIPGLFSLLTVYHYSKVRLIRTNQMCLVVCRWLLWLVHPQHFLTPDLISVSPCWCFVVPAGCRGLPIIRSHLREEMRSKKVSHPTSWERGEFSIIYLKLHSGTAGSYRAEEAVKNIHNSTLCYSRAGAVRGRDSG